jgi:hypothetical protein
MAESIDTLISRINNPKLREEYRDMTIAGAHGEAMRGISDYTAEEVERLADVLAEQNENKRAYELVTHPTYLTRVKDASTESAYNVVLELTVGKNTRLFVRTQCDSKEQFETWFKDGIMRDGTRDRIENVYKILAQGITDRQAQRITRLIRWGPYKGSKTTEELEQVDRSKDSAAIISGLHHI